MDTKWLLQLLWLRYLSSIAVFRQAVSGFSNLKRFFSFIMMKDHALTLYFMYLGLVPCTIDLDHETVMHFWVPKHRRFQKPVLVLIHGFGANSRWQWENQAKPLSEKFNLFVPDLIFFGKSVTKSTDRTDVFQARCIVESMKGLGVTRFSVCGISYGGYVAFRMADLYKDEIDKVVIMSSGICSTVEQRKEMVEVGGRCGLEMLLPKRAEDLLDLMKRTMYRQPPPWIPAFVLQDFIKVMYVAHRKERREMLEVLLWNQRDINSLPVLNQEALLIWGDKDNVFPLFMGHQLKRHLGQKSRLEIIKDVGHASQMEKPDTVNNLITAFILESKEK